MKVEKYATVYWLIVCTSTCTSTTTTATTIAHTQTANVRKSKADELFLFLLVGLGMKWNSKQLFIVHLAAAASATNQHAWFMRAMFLWREEHHSYGFFLSSFYWIWDDFIYGHEEEETLLAFCRFVCVWVLVEFNWHRTLIWFKLNLEQK